MNIKTVDTASLWAKYELLNRRGLIYEQWHVVSHSTEPRRTSQVNSIEKIFRKIPQPSKRKLEQLPGMTRKK
jgi:hypothetical protein